MVSECSNSQSLPCNVNEIFFIYESTYNYVYDVNGGECAGAPPSKEQGLGPRLRTPRNDLRAGTGEPTRAPRQSARRLEAQAP